VGRVASAGAEGRAAVVERAGVGGDVALAQRAGLWGPLAMKTNPGRFFEDYRMGEVIVHAVPRTVSGGERALYHALYPARWALYSSDAFARASGLAQSPMDDLIAFHTVFGKTVPDISLNAVANLGYAEGRWLQPVWPGDTLRSESTVIGVKENSSGTSGVVWVRTRGLNQHDVPVLDYVRWVMVRKRGKGAAPDPVVPELAKAVEAQALVVPQGLDFTRYDFALSGEPHRWGDYRIGETIDHVDGVTVEEAEHMLATRLWQNTAKVHFDATQRADGKRLIYGGHIVSLARALSFNGLANAQMMVALNAGAHANPCFAGDTVRAWSQVLDRAETTAPGVGALRLRLVAVKDGTPPFALRDGAGIYLPGVLLDLDYWALLPI
jgi:2-methylfumaryl-CoA hydratase